MFEDGLHNRVNIYKLNRNQSNRKVKDDIKVSDEPDMENVPCRIIKDEKILFAGKLELEDGYEVKDIDSGFVYEIRNGNQIRGIGDVHHSSYKIRLKSESSRHG